MCRLYFISFALLLFLSGCALGDRNIALNYQPVVSAPSARLSESGVTITKFKDMRAKSILGEVRNAYGMKTASVKADHQDVGAWVAEALAKELERNGLEVIRAESDRADSGGVITGSVMEAYVKAYMNYRTTVKVQLTMHQDGIPILNREYTGSSKGGVGFASASEYEKQLSQALEDVMRQAVPDVVNELGK